MMHGFFVRTAGEKDLEAIRTLLVETWHATYDGIYGAGKVSEITTSWHTVEALRPRLGRLNSEFLVADDGERLGGVAFAASAGDDAKLVVIHQLYVLPQYQRAGVGSDLLTEIANSFPDASRLRLEVEAANEAAVAFCEIHGFRRADPSATVGEGGETIPAIVMEKPLRQG